jgi:uncharacterized protein
LGSNKTYVIPFAGLSNGKHQFEFEVSDKFFENYAESEIEKADLRIDVDLHKQSTMLIFDFKIKGTFTTICDRCADFFNMPLEGQHQLVVKLSDEENAEDEEVIIVATGEHEINLAPHIYEFISLSLPYRKVHPDDSKGNSGCDPETLAKLKDLLINKEEPPVDPRWEALRKLKF